MKNATGQWIPLFGNQEPRLLFYRPNEERNKKIHSKYMHTTYFEQIKFTATAVVAVATAAAFIYQLFLSSHSSPYSHFLFDFRNQSHQQQQRLFYANLYKEWLEAVYRYARDAKRYENQHKEENTFQNKSLYSCVGRVIERFCSSSPCLEWERTKTRPAEEWIKSLELSGARKMKTLRPSTIIIEYRRELS